MSRTMSGIATGGGGGDVSLAGNPNAFTGTNTYDVNRPTSTIATTPSATDLITKQNADTLYTNNTGDAVLAAGTVATPQEFTGVNDFNGGSLQMTNETSQNFQMIQTDTTTSVNNSFIMTGVNNRIQQTSLSNGVVNEFKQSGGATTASSISQYTPTSTIYQDSTTATIITNGKIGIGTTSPSFPLHITSGDANMSDTTTFSYLKYNAGGVGRGSGWGDTDCSIFADGTIFSATYTGASDLRIKKDIMDLLSALPLIEQIKPRTYKYQDPKRGDKMAYGFIAQELEEVIPELIKTTQHKIPNIMKTADVRDGVFTLKEASDLQVDDEIDIYDEGNTELKVKITEIISDKSFKTNIDTQLKDKYFIYGKYVDDFKGIEHNGLLPVMIKGIQELNAKNKSLEDRLAILEDKLNNM